MKKVLKLIINIIAIFSLSFGISYVFADWVNDTKNKIAEFKSNDSALPGDEKTEKGSIGFIFKNIFNTNGIIKKEFLEVNSVFQKNGNNAYYNQGSVGIGDSTPDAKLDVNGWLKIDDENKSGDALNLETQNGFHRMAFNQLRFYDWDTKGDMVTFNNGNVGIGTTNPSDKLDINGSLKMKSVANILADGKKGYVASRLYLNSHEDYRGAGIFSKGQTKEWFWGNPYTDHDDGMMIGVGNVGTGDAVAQKSNSLLYIKNSGNVGIGTTSPIKKLHVKGEGSLFESDGWNHFDIKGQGDGKDGVLRLYSGNDFWSFHNDDSDSNKMSIRYNNNTKLTLSNNGNVGIGTISPSEKLEVSSDAKFHGLTVGRYGKSLAGDSNPFHIYSPSNSGVHDLTLFGNSKATLNFRILDGDIKVGYSKTPNATIKNDGSASFKGSVGIGTTNPQYKLQVNGSVCLGKCH